MKTALTLTLLLACTLAFGQQNVVFDLNTGKFDKKLSYIEHIHVKGIPFKDGTKIDIIELIITSKNKSFDSKIDKKEGELAQSVIQLNKLEKLIADNGIAEEHLKEYTKILEDLTKEKAKPTADQNTADISTWESELTALKTSSKGINEAKKELEAAKKSQLISEIAELKAKAAEKQEYQRIYWERKGDEKEFSLALTKILTMAESYYFQFNLYSHSEQEFPVGELTKKIVDEVATKIELNNFLPRPQIESLIEKELDSICKVYFNAKTVFASGKGFTEVEEKSLQNKPAIISAFADLLAPSGNLAATTKNQRDLITLLFNDLNSLANGPKLYKDSTAKQELNDLFFNFDTGRLNEFESLMKRFEIDSTQASAIWKKADIRGADDNYASIQRDKASIENAKIQIQKLLAPQIKSLYVKKFELKHSTVGSSEDTKLDATRIGTHYGIGGISMENWFQVTELTQYIALNLRWDAYDNRLPGKEAFKSHWSRYSFLVGIGTTSNLEYKGQSLSNTRLGFKPMIGLSFQPIKHMDISVSTFAFTQESISSEQSYTITKFRPMVGIAFDFNAVNFLINKNK